MQTRFVAASQCPCFYLLSAEALKEVSNFLQEEKDAPMSEKDATGNFLNYLHKRYFMHRLGWSYSTYGTSKVGRQLALLATRSVLKVF